jgi:hypothetical protein
MHRRPWSDVAMQDGSPKHGQEARNGHRGMIARNLITGSRDGMRAGYRIQ